MYAAGERNRHRIISLPQKDKLAAEEEPAGTKEALTQWGRRLKELGRLISRFIRPRPRDASSASGEPCSTP
jgi:hypothetical protein